MAMEAVEDVEERAAALNIMMDSLRDVEMHACVATSLLFISFYHTQLVTSYYSVYVCVCMCACVCVVCVCVCVLCVRA